MSAVMTRRQYLGRKYARIMTGSYWPFILYVLFFVTLIVAAGSQVTTKVMESWPCFVTETEEGIVIRVDAPIAANFDTLYLYTDKNQDFRKFTAVSVTLEEDITVIAVLESELLRQLAAGFGETQTYVEIPVGEITLLRRIIPLGERGP